MKGSGLEQKILTKRTRKLGLSQQGDSLPSHQSEDLNCFHPFSHLYHFVQTSVCYRVAFD